MNSASTARIIPLAAFALLIACGSERTTSAPPVASVEVRPSEAGIIISQTVQLTAKVKDPAGNDLTGRQITWTSNAPAYATVSSTGMVTGVAPASSVVITATSEGRSGTSTITVRAPLNLQSVSAGMATACGVTTNGAAYCWGDNGFGELGNGTTTSSTVPMAVAGGLTFTSVTTWGAMDDGHTCGVTTSAEAYCWGSGQYGQLGIGTNTGSIIPALVSGGLQFTQLTAGIASTCGLTTTGAAYCWGLNLGGSFGDGSTASSSVPVPAGGGLTFSALSTRHVTCGVTPTGVGYCWGITWKASSATARTPTAWSQCASPVGSRSGP